MNEHDRGEGMGVICSYLRPTDYKDPVKPPIVF